MYLSKVSEENHRKILAGPPQTGNLGEWESHLNSVLTKVREEVTAFMKVKRDLVEADPSGFSSTLINLCRLDYDDRNVPSNLRKLKDEEFSANCKLATWRKNITGK